jgi:spore maturation protein CgeB
VRFALFYHSLLSDWNHGNAHFLRGLMRALQARGHETACYEQVDNWSLTNLLAEAPTALDDFRRRFPDLHFDRYHLDPTTLEAWLRPRLEAADVAIVNEWVANEPWVAAMVARICRSLGKPALFHDTHYRVVLEEPYRRALELERFDAILAFGPALAARYRALGYSNVHVVHEAADTTVFEPFDLPKRDDVLFVGNYGDGDRGRELEQYVFGPRRELPQLGYAIYGVRYPDDLLARLRDGLRTDYRGWLPNADVPRAFAQAKVVLHVPRRQYVDLLPGTPTIRVFEALACGACLVSLPWPDTDGLFRADDFVVARTPDDMRDLVAWLCADETARRAYGANGRETVLARHTCGHRADQILELLR